MDIEDVAFPLVCWGKMSEFGFDFLLLYIIALLLPLLAFLLLDMTSLWASEKH